jgi:CSLREA domain-containing protein
MRGRTRSVVIGGVVGLLVAAATAAHALVFEVLTTLDKPDAAIDGVCADVDGVCTLRAAIQEANAHPGEEIINIIGAKNQRFPLKVVGANEDAAATGDLDSTCGFGVGDRPNAGKLQLKALKVDHDFGLIPTYELKPNSPAIDAGVDTGCLELDQNSRPRIDVPTVPNLNGSICDSGATEFELP